MDRADYLRRKAHFDNFLTICGRKPVLEALKTPELKSIKLHFSEKNRPATILEEIQTLASEQGVAIEHHSAAKLSRISKSAKQDQGVALDLECPNFMTLEMLLSEEDLGDTMIALDNVTNPQNLGMIIRSVAASPCTAIILPRKGCAPLNALVIKASAGNLFKAPIVRVNSLCDALHQCKKRGYNIASLEAEASNSVLDQDTAVPTIFVLGNETNGVSEEIKQACDRAYRIPMKRGVESLNVAVTASLIAYRGLK